MYKWEDFYCDDFFSKSVWYEVPPMHKQGEFGSGQVDYSIVVAMPLVSLTVNQITSLREFGIAAAILIVQFEYFINVQYAWINHVYGSVWGIITHAHAVHTEPFFSILVALVQGFLL